ncbi:site-specific integrase [Bacteroides ovatus]|uniref:site-specific integrase n=1 Tax=Bacteroides ovatus TaxID=28116 RepID=UPI00203091BD|nr:site-specific integrase [Bacteroides ovatus]MCM1604015.1 site-specific integrase [Bacteroides ovatus]MCM1621831.1 site-specific integrase [Bacteroides ovatus]MCM1641222.1 site-specific integrase [Bacteroides ovatus]MCM1648950.1 site-specific integrase [Bacteroides ovatus]MCM1668717.1 site-specific integrase [Bacteroides ovatus]
MKRQYHKEYLTREELTAFLKVKLSSERLENVRDVFVFSCFTGLVYGDLKKLRTEQLMTLPSGSHYLQIYVPMTRFPRTIPLLDIPYKIIEKYKGQQEDGGLFPIFPLPVMNIRLREIASECGINKPITTFSARRTFATTIVSENGIPLETAAKMLGHSLLKSTLSVTCFTENKIANDMSAISGQFKDMETMFNL